MAFIPKDAYPAQTLDSDPDYPHGKARNEVTAGDGTGYPLEQQWVNDLLGFEQALLAEGGITPSGNPDNTDESQYVDAIRRLPVTWTQGGDGDATLDPRASRFVRVPNLSANRVYTLPSTSPLTTGDWCLITNESATFQVAVLGVANVPPQSASLFVNRGGSWYRAYSAHLHPPALAEYQVSGLSVTTGNKFTLALLAAGTGYSLASDEITVPRAGIYRVHFDGTVGNTGADRGIGIRVAGTLVHRRRVNVVDNNSGLLATTKLVTIATPATDKISITAELNTTDMILGGASEVPVLQLEWVSSL